MTITLIILILLSITCTYIVYVQYSRATRLESIVNNLANQLETVGTIIASGKKSLDNPNLVQAFSNDDEVGVFFKEIQELQKQLNEFIPTENEEIQ